MRKKVLCFAAIASLTSVLLTGCWDKVEIDQRGFVGVIMVDMASPGYEEKENEEIKNIPGADVQTGEMFKVTYTFPDTALLGGEGGEGGGDEKGFISMTSVATSLSKAARYVDSRISRRLYFGHTQCVIFGEEVLKNPDKFKEAIGYLEEGQQFSRNMLVIAAQGEASKIADINPKDEKLLFRYLRETLSNEVLNARMVNMTFNKFACMLRDNEGDGIIPKVVPYKDEVKIAGLGIIKDYRLLGYLSEYDTLYFNTLAGRRKGGVISFNMGDITMAFTSSDMSRKITLANSDPENLEVVIKMEIEGDLSDDPFDIDIFDAEKIKDIQKVIDKSTEDSCKFVIDKLQKEFGVDALEIGEYLYKFHPSVWDKVKDNWDEVYPSIKITPVVKHMIRRVGVTK